MSRYDSVERSKALGILLVVFGHAIPTPFNDGTPRWIIDVWSTIYSFHMPLFMILSGLVFFHGSKIRGREIGVRALIWQKVDRLLVPAVIITLAVLAAKSAAGIYWRVHDPYRSFLDSLYAVITNQPDNPALSVWYLFVLFVFSIVTYLAVRRWNVSIHAAFVLSIALYFVDAPEIFYIDRLLHYYVFFLLGGIIALDHQRYLRLMDLAWKYMVFLLLFAILAGAYPLDHKLLYGSFVSLLILFFFNRPQRTLDPFLFFLGRRTMVIYMFNTIFCGAARLVITAWIGPAALFHPLSLLVVALAGVLGPVLMLEVAERLPGCARVTRYMR